MLFYAVVRNYFRYLYSIFIQPIVDLFYPRTPYLPRDVKPTSEIPGPTFPWAFAFLGDAANFNKVGGPERFLDYVSQLHAKYGNIVKTQLGSQKFVFVNTLELYKEIARHEPRCPASFKLPASEAFDRKHDIARGLFFQDGKNWYNGRSLVTQALLKNTGNFMSLVFSPVEEILDTIIADWSAKSMQNGGLIPTIEQDCYEFFIGSISAITIGRNYKKYFALAGTDVSKLANTAVKLINSTSELNACPIWIATTLRLKCWKEYEEYTLYNLKSGRKATDAAMEALKLAENGGSHEEFGLLYRFKNLCQTSDEDTRIHCTDFMSDISDPVSISTLWTLYAIGRHVEVQDKILAEIESVFGDSQHSVKYEDLDKLPFLRAVFKEVLRLFPSAPMTIRNPTTYVVLGGYNITSDYIVALSTFESHKNPAYFSDPERFWPERWMGQEIDPATGNRLKCDDAYIPFGIGKRMCAGKHLAQSMIKLLLTKVVQNFTVETTEVKTKLKIMLYPDGDMKLRLTPRSNKKTN